MIRPSRLGSTFCPDPYGTLSYLNPACWAEWGAQNSAQAQQDACSKASGGSITSDLYQRCISQMAGNAAAQAAADPQGAAAYEGVTGDNPIGYITGLTDAAGAPSTASKALLYAGIAAGAAFLWSLRR